MGVGGEEGEISRGRGCLSFLSVEDELERVDNGSMTHTIRQTD